MDSNPELNRSDYKALYERFKIEFAVFAKRGDLIIAYLSGVQVWSLINAIQFALRNPEFRGNGRFNVRNIGISLQQSINATPAMQEMANLGWSIADELPSLHLEKNLN